MDLTLDDEKELRLLREVIAQRDAEIAELKRRNAALQTAVKAYEQGARYLRDAVKMFGDDVMRETVLG